MKKSDDRRAIIIDALAGHVLAHGIAASSLRPLAEAAGLSDRMLLYYFKDKAEVMAAALGRVAERLTALMAQKAQARTLPPAALRDALLPMLLSDALWPYMCVWLELAALSARGDPLYRGIGEAIGRGFLAWGRAHLDSPAERLDADAHALLTEIEGTLLLRALGIGPA
ncbi:TetR/AcrR family transcriptional regulator [Sandarakinorhabdus sp.]|uniref:TetR/AcrR family transcriptional regulator n=1 Tax=Sandarakinorhabdus sp. TaxID=1916663 RepID=UPI00286D7860|nr:TetR/AcrR family transcriptional regulator [Sandarakinorhabdus sp.]